MEASRRIAVAGSTGRVGKHVVDVLQSRGHDVVEMSRTTGVDLISGEGLANALSGVERIVDVASGPSPDEREATDFFVTASRNLQQHGARAGVQHIVVVSIVGADRFSRGYNVAKVAHERAMQAGPIPATILRATQFHEFVEQLVDWGTQGDVGNLPNMRTQLIAARSVAEALADLASFEAPSTNGQIAEIAGPRVESLIEVATLLATRRGTPARIEAVSDPDDPDRELFETDGLLPGPDARIAGPTYAEWLERAR